jgi:flagellar biosynthesis chaperone FliJ
VNKQRRNAIDKLTTTIADLMTKMEDARDELETLKDEEQEYYDNMPESLQGGEKGERAVEVCDLLDSALSNFDSMRNEIEEAIQSCNSACE